MEKYKVYDLLEEKEVLGYAADLVEVKRLAKERYEDTDGECLVMYAILNKETNKYKFSNRMMVLL